MRVGKWALGGSFQQDQGVCQSRASELTKQVLNSLPVLSQHVATGRHAAQLDIHTLGVWMKEGGVCLLTTEKSAVTESGVQR